LLTIDLRRELRGRPSRQPEVLDFVNAREVICEEIAAKGHCCVGDAELFSKETCQEGEYFGIAVRQPRRVAPFGAFGAIQHAAGGVQRTAFSRELATVLLVAASYLTRSCRFLRSGHNRPEPAPCDQPPSLLSR
jgi:hypothetical protein